MDQQQAYHIVVDSGCDLLDCPQREDGYTRVSCDVDVDGQIFTEGNADTDALLAAMKVRTGKVNTACPSPADYLAALSRSASNFIVTLSSKVSGSNNSARLAKEMLFEESPEVEAHVFDTKSAAAGQSLVALRVRDLVAKGLPFQRIVEDITAFIPKMRTLFLLESLENLVKNGRMSKVNYIVGSTLRINPIMGENGDGEIALKVKTMGKKNALRKLIDMVGSYEIDFKNVIMSITHVNALEKALAIKDELLARYHFQDIVIFRAGNMSTVYGDDGGIILAFPTV